MYYIDIIMKRSLSADTPFSLSLPTFGGVCTEKEKIAKINFLARKAREQGLSPQEKAEQEALRNEYREGFRKNLLAQLEGACAVKSKSTDGKE